MDYKSGNLLVLTFDEILNYELYEDGSHQTVGGNIGGLFSGFFGAETTGTCKELKLIVRLKKYDTPQVCYEIISDTIFNIGIDKSSKPYKQCVSTLQEVVSFLEFIKHENEVNTKKDTII